MLIGAFQESLRAPVPIAISVLFACCGAVSADSVMLSSGNSSATFQTTPSYAPDRVGNDTWTVDNVHQLYERWFWFREGEGTHESTIDTLPQTGLTTSANVMAVQYTGEHLQLSLSCALTGGNWGTGQSRMLETFTVRNLTGQVLPFHAFEYADFDLRGDPGGETIQFLAPGIVRQQEGDTYLTSTITGLVPVRRELGIYPSTRNALNDGTLSMLSNYDGPVGPGDVTWAFEWDVEIEPGQSISFFNDMRFTTPEPTALAILFGTGPFLLRRRAMRPAQDLR